MFLLYAVVKTKMIGVYMAAWNNSQSQAKEKIFYMLRSGTENKQT